MRVNLQSRIEAELQNTGLPWSIDNGRRHKHIRLDGRLIGILPKSGGTDEGYALRNTIAQIRRQARYAGGAA